MTMNDDEMTLAEIEEQTQQSDLYSPTIKRVMKKFSDALRRRRKERDDDPTRNL